MQQHKEYHLLVQYGGGEKHSEQSENVKETKQEVKKKYGLLERDENKCIKSENHRIIQSLNGLG